MTGRWTGRLADLRAELVLLRASHRALGDRVVSIERRARVSVGRRASQAAPPLGADVELDPALAEALATPPHRFEPMTLPEASAILAGLLELFGAPSGLVIDEPNARPRRADRGLYASAFVDDANAEVGALLVSVPLALRMASALLGFRESAVAEQIRSGVLGQEALLAMNEVGSNVCGVVNAGGGGAVRASELSAFSSERYPWLKHAAKSLCLTDADGDSLWIVAR